MVKRRSIFDLYKKGKLVILDDGETPEGEEPAAVYLKKLNQIESEKALRMANAEKAKIMAASRDHNSEMYLSTTNTVDLMSREQLLDEVVDYQVGKMVPAIEDEIGAEDEWSKDDYIQGLHDAWEGGLMEAHHTEPTEESERVWSEMQRFAEQVKVRYDGERLNLVRDYDTKSDEQLKELALQQLIQRQADFSWLRAFRRAELFLAAKDPDDQSMQFFHSAEQLDDLESPTFIRLVQEHNALNVEILEGKDSPQTAASSESSEQPEQPETVPSSGPQAVPV